MFEDNHLDNTKNIPIEKLVSALLDTETTLNPRYLYRLSDIESGDLVELERSWPKVPAWRRKALLEDLEELAERDTLLSYEAVCRMALGDSNPEVRMLAIRSLWEYDAEDLIPRLIDFMESDEALQVRAAAASALGKYVYQGEVDEIPAHTLRMVEDRLIAVARGGDVSLVRRRALESLGYSGREEVSNLIHSAYYSDEDEWLESSLFAMGRSANRDWSSHVFDMLNHEIPEIRMEAVRASGELGIQRATPHLLDLLEDPDEGVYLAAVWSLSQIGGEGVWDTMERLFAQARDDQEAELIEAAMDNLAFTEDLQRFSLFEMPDVEADFEDGAIAPIDDEDLPD
jgi:HEAT repeat protein